MNDNDPTSPDEIASARTFSHSTSYRGSRWIVVAVLMSAVIGFSAACGPSSATATSPSAPAAGSGLGSGGGGSNARSGPASGGAAGTVASVSTSSFTMSTSAGQKVTIDEASSTTYQKGTSSISASAITTGDDVLVLGTTSGTTITAAQVIVQPTGSAASSATGVIPFQPGAPSSSKQVGQIPANYSQGSGTIVSGTTANKATEAALAAYPGGVVDRVVQLSNGEYEVHYIGVNWPHHIFVNQDFKVVGAN
jgi:membrane-bound inhibitor of C-type lysozyme